MKLRFDLPDTLIVVGLLVLAVALWHFSPWLTLAEGGVTLLAVGLVNSR